MDSGGNHLNNIGESVGNKKEFLNNYKFKYVLKIQKLKDI